MDQEKELSQLTLSEWVKSLGEKQLFQFSAPEYGELLRRIRQHKDLTQWEMADVLDAGHTTYQKWERGMCKPHPHSRRKIRDKFEDPLYAWGILKREGEPEDERPAGKRNTQQVVVDQQTSASPVVAVIEHPVFSPSLEVQKRASGSPATDRNSGLVEQPTPAGTHQEAVHLSLSTEEVALLSSIVKGDDLMNFDESKRDTLRRIAAVVLAASQSSTIGSFALSDPEPWERLLRAKTASSPSTFLSDATLEYFEDLLRISWQLCDQNQFAPAEGVLLSFLPQLLLLPRQESRTAFLASNGLRLQSILAHHHLGLSDKVRLCEQSVDYARQVGNANTLVTALIELAIAYEYVRQPDSLKKRLITLQEALDQSCQASPLVQSRTYWQYSAALAESGRIREAQFYIGLAQEVFPDDPTQDPGFAFADGGNIFSFSYRAGLVHIHTGSIDRAFPAFEHYKQHPSGLFIPDRFRLLIVNGQSRAAILDNDAERYADLLEDVLIGSVRIGSQKRFDEALDIFREEMPVSWLSVSRIQQLVEQYGLKREM